MLGKADWHKSVPKDPARNCRWRAQLLDRCTADPLLRQGVMEACASDILFWINAFVVQYNPRHIGSGSLKVGPFLTWDKQDALLLEILHCYGRHSDLVIEKSREMGVSWLCLLVITWLFLFHKHERLFVVSRKAELVDKSGDPDSLFWKIKYVLSHLPEWMAGPEWIKHQKMAFRNSRTSSTIDGEATTGKAGVGGRATMMFVDEFSRIDQARELYQGTASTAGCRIFCGTHFGVGTKFHELTEGGCRKFVLHWTDHPDKRRGLYRYIPEKGIEYLDPTFQYAPDFEPAREEKPTGGPHPGLRSPWYDRECPRIGDSRGVAMDLDIDPAGSKKQFFDAIKINELRRRYARQIVPDFQGDISCDTDTGEFLGLVERPDGPLKIWLPFTKDGKPPPSSYAAGADISQGTGATPSCFSLMDARTGEKVCAYVDRWTRPERFAAICYALCWLFKDEDNQGAMFAWEKEGPGVSFGKKIIQLGYRRVYYAKDETKLLSKNSDLPGWPSRREGNKYDLILQYRIALEKELFINRDDSALAECLEFEYTGQGQVAHMKSAAADDPSAAGENHGDQVVADALAWKMGGGLIRQRKSEVPRSQVVAGTKAWRVQLQEDRLRQDEDEWID